MRPIKKRHSNKNENNRRIDSIGIATRMNNTRFWFLDWCILPCCLFIYSDLVEKMTMEKITLMHSQALSRRNGYDNNNNNNRPKCQFRRLFSDVLLTLYGKIYRNYCIICRKAKVAWSHKSRIRPFHNIIILFHSLHAMHTIVRAIW